MDSVSIKLAIEFLNELLWSLDDAILEENNPEDLRRFEYVRTNLNKNVVILSAILHSRHKKTPKSN